MRAEVSGMIFQTASAEPRPVRLRESTRAWAMRSMRGAYGDDAMRCRFVSLDAVEGFASLSSVEQYNCAIRQIATDAPLRICEEERVCGAATLGGAIGHVVPAQYQGKTVFGSVSHLTLRYDKVLHEGLDGYASELARRLADPTLSAAQHEFLHSLQNVIESMAIWHARYLEATETARPELHRLLRRVPFSPARNFHEALQALWFVFAFARLCGNWPGIGRIDVLLGDYLERDLRAGVLTREEARELTASFFIKGCEWIQSDTPLGSGDAQHYQNIVLAGADESGREVANTMTELVLEVVEELGISDFPITVRLNRRSPQALKEKIAAVMRHGGGVVAVYNEDLILEALSDLHYTQEEARRFANDGCWEVQIPGKTDFSYMPFDALQLLDHVLGTDGAVTPDYASIEALYAAFLQALRQTVAALYDRTVKNAFTFRDGAWQATTPPTCDSVVSLFEDGCIEHARAYRDFGPTYVVRSPHIGGAPDVANSLYAIEKLVFEERKVTLPQLVDLLRKNWEGQETLRLYVKNRYSYYGNDAPEADAWHARLLNDFADAVEACRTRSDCPVLFIPGVSTFGRQIEWAPQRCATAFGSKKGEILSGNDSPVPGTDFSGATSLIRSYCKSDLKRQSCGAALDVKIFPDSLRGENGIAALVGLMDGFLKLGGFFLQLDVVDAAVLREAQKNPQQYKTLSVRVSGWSARFVTLSENWQNMIIERTAQRPS